MARQIINVHSLGFLATLAETVTSHISVQFGQKFNIHRLFKFNFPGVENMIYKILRNSIPILALCILSSQLRADALPAELHNAANKITQVLVEKERESFSIESFKDNTHGNFGPGLRSQLVQAFQEVNQSRKTKGEKFISVVEKSSVSLSGEFKSVDDPGDQSLLAIEIKMIVSEGGEIVFPLTLFVNRIRDIAQFEGVNFRTENDKSVTAAHKELRQAINNPSFEADGSRIRSKAGSPISVEIAAKSALAGPDTKAQPRSPSKEHSDFPFVPVGVGEIYEVIVHNDSNVEIAAALSVDGLDQFTFSEDRNPETGSPKFTCFIVAPRSSLTIPGWHKTVDKKRNDNFLSFLVTKYGDGASKFVPHPDRARVGVITVAISMSHIPGKGRARGDAETGFGPPVRVEQEAVSREIDPPHEFISIRYNR
jgi:hypothetical protein